MNQENNYKFVDENANILEGDQTKQIVMTFGQFMEGWGDSRYVGESGIINVSKNRWETAQKYERSEWLQRGYSADDDRNLFHEDTFKSYQCLNNVSINSFIELGCGPFTNARIILEKFPNINEITLLDPLVEDYLGHKNCKYKNSKLQLRNGQAVEANLVASSIEEYETTKTFDMVVMINVLEHCFDIPKIFSTVDHILNTDGVLIYADVQFDIETVKKMAKLKYNAGHPIRPTKDYINNILDSKFEQVFSTVFNEEVSGMMAEERYFIGKKL